MGAVAVPSLQNATARVGARGRDELPDPARTRCFVFGLMRCGVDICTVILHRPSRDKNACLFEFRRGACTVAPLSGRARIRVGRRLQRAKAGESVVVPRGTVHRLWNDGEDELHALVEFRPALRTEEGFEQLFGLGQDGKLSTRGFPHPLQIAVMAKEYRDEAQFPLVPARVQRALIAPLAAIGARLGYRPFDPRYGAGPDPAP
jgi:hypothetical protein